MVSFGAGISCARAQQHLLGGYPLGFWFAHQGAILHLHRALIFWYAKKMGDIDRQFDVHEE